jgi:hypothetical protein
MGVTCLRMHEVNKNSNSSLRKIQNPSAAPIVVSSEWHYHYLSLV